MIRRRSEMIRLQVIINHSNHTMTWWKTDWQERLLLRLPEEDMNSLRRDLSQYCLASLENPMNNPRQFRKLNRKFQRIGQKERKNACFCYSIIFMSCVLSPSLLIELAVKDVVLVILIYNSPVKYLLSLFEEYTCIYVILSLSLQTSRYQFLL